jgi:chitinase
MRFYPNAVLIFLFALLFNPPASVGQVGIRDRTAFGESFNKDAFGSQSGGTENPKVILGYFRSWDKTQANSLPWKTLTHVSHAFVSIQDEGELSWDRQIPSDLLTSIAHRHDVKVLLSIGGEGSGERLFEIANSPTKRKNFLASVIKTIKAFGYDGIDIDWEFPNATTSNAFHSLLSAVRAELNLHQNVDQPFILSAAIPASDWHGKWIDAKQIAEHCDLLQIMAYDFTGPWSTHALHHSATLASEQDLKAGGYSVSQALNYWLKERAVPANKCLIGIPLYGRVFSASKVGASVVNAPKHSQQPPTLPLHKIDELRRAGWRRLPGPDPWLQAPNQQSLVAFDDPASVEAKCQIAKDLGCRGAFVWALGDEKTVQPELLRAAFNTFAR